MDALIENACKKAMYGLRNGGQIPQGVAEAYAEDAIARFHSLTGICKSWLPAIDEEEGETIYALPGFEDSNRHVCRVSGLFRLSDPSDFKTRRAMPPNSYGIGSSGVPGSDPGLWVTLASGSPCTATGSLLALAVFSRRDSTDIAPMYIDDATEGVAAYVLHMVCSDSGKPWADPNKTAQEYLKWERHLAMARLLAMRDGVERMVEMRAPTGWI